MVEFDRDDFDAAEAHARVALKLYERLQDPWGDLESRLLLSQVALGRRDPRAESFVVACDRVMIDEAEPRQHRHLTRAWLAGSQGQWTEAAIEIDAARDTFAVRRSHRGFRTSKPPRETRPDPRFACNAANDRNVGEVANCRVTARLARAMSTPQDPPVRRKQKARRAKKLAAWRLKNAAAAEKAETSTSSK